MTSDNKPPMFGNTEVIEPASHLPYFGKSALMNQMMAELAGKAIPAETIIGNCTTTIPLKLDLHDGGVSHSVIIAPSGTGMSVFTGTSQPLVTPCTERDQ